MAQIQRLEDAATNPLTGSEWPADHSKIVQGRRTLPVHGNLDEILEAYHQNQVLVLSCETGSGKSSQIPQMLFYDEYESGLRVACTQPRRLAATTLAERVSKEMAVVLGEEVGYVIGGEKKMDKKMKKSRLLYMTEDSLVRRLGSDNNFPDFACIIIDEAHERTVEADMLMALLKKTLRHRKDLKLIIMSAPVNISKFQDYFNGCPLVHVAGQNHKVEINYLAPRTACNDLRALAVNVVAMIHQSYGPGNILVFLPGQGEINQVCDLLRKYLKDLDVFALYSKLSSRKQHMALNPEGPNRKCIVSTNIAETSLTIDNIVYVVDSGLSRQLVYNPRLDMDMLRVAPISQASANQRAGRAGLTKNGVCLRLYSKEDFELMDASTEPDIRRRSFQATALRLLSIGYMNIVGFKWMDAPHPDSILRAAQDLQDWGFLKDDGFLTPLGRIAAHFPIDPIWYRAIHIGAGLGCAFDIVDIAVVCHSQKSIFAHAPEHQRVADLFRATAARYPSDHVALANFFHMFMAEREKCQPDEDPRSKLHDWCKYNFLDFDALEGIRNTRKRLHKFLGATAKLKPSMASQRDVTSVPKALAIAFAHHAAIYNGGDDEYRTVPENTSGRLSPTSCLVNGNWEWIVYHRFSATGTKVYFEIATAIDAEWLVDLPNFQENQLALKKDGSLRQPKVKNSLDAAKARIAASTTI
ncbi:unnamed protein product [Clonostachys byssicola]|uniref:Pre-mRNA-splicing factor ATP-dependent RNA helicase PRP43 n=1 Tax=Clonostachys byssicola TaxID=160290 RepID=A0A9N9XYM4_9HYPO|nr:unnamed protein product [Clonostachys byssicola]